MEVRADARRGEPHRRRQPRHPLRRRRRRAAVRRGPTSASAACATRPAIAVPDGRSVYIAGGIGDSGKLTALAAIPPPARSPCARLRGRRTSTGGPARARGVHGPTRPGRRRPTAGASYLAASSFTSCDPGRPVQLLGRRRTPARWSVFAPARAAQRACLRRRERERDGCRAAARGGALRAVRRHHARRQSGRSAAFDKSRRSRSSRRNPPTQALARAGEDGLRARPRRGADARLRGCAAGIGQPDDVAISPDGAQRLRDDAPAGSAMFALTLDYALRHRKFGPRRTFRWHDSRCRAARMQPLAPRSPCRPPPRRTGPSRPARPSSTAPTTSAARPASTPPRATAATATSTRTSSRSRTRPPTACSRARSVRALVVKGADGKLRRDRLRRPLHPAGRAVAAHRAARSTPTTGGAINETNLTMSVTHNHSSPSYSSLDWGVWTFQDVFDFRFFDYYAQPERGRGQAGASNTCTTCASARPSSYFDAFQTQPDGPGLGRRRHARRLPAPTPTTTCRSSASRTSTTRSTRSRSRRSSTSASTPSSSRATT